MYTSNAYIPNNRANTTLSIEIGRSSSNEQGLLYESNEEREEDFITESEIPNQTTTPIESDLDQKNIVQEESPAFNVIQQDINEVDPSLLCIANQVVVSICDINLRTPDNVFFEGKIISIYGTYNNNQWDNKYMRIDLTDRFGLNGTITLNIDEDYYEQYRTTLVVKDCISISGFSVQTKTSKAGGTSEYVLIHTHRTRIIHIKNFDVYPYLLPSAEPIAKFKETALQHYNLKTSSNKGHYTPQLLTSVGVAVIRVNPPSKSFNSLRVTDGSTSNDHITVNLYPKYICYS